MKIKNFISSIILVISSLIPNFIHLQSSFTNLSATLTSADSLPTSTQAQIDSLIVATRGIILSPLRKTYFQESCMSSHHCKYGTCNLQYHYCQCDKGYSLNNCEYSNSQISQFASISSKFVTFIETNYPLAFINATPTEEQLQRICKSVRQGFKVADAIPESDADKIQQTLIALMDKASVLTNVVSRLQVVEAIGYTVEVYYSKLRNFRESYVKSEVVADYTTYTSKKADIQSKIQALLTKMQTKYLPQIATALNNSETTFKVRTNIFTAQLVFGSSKDIISETRSLKYNGSNYVKYQIQGQLLGNPVPAPFDVIEQIIQYYAHPSLTSSIFQQSLFTHYNIYKPDKSAVTLSPTGSIIYKIPLARPQIFRSSDIMSCYQWDGFSQGDCFTLRVSASSIICSCRGSTGSLVYGQLRNNKHQHVTAGLKGVYTDYDGYKYWEKSLGFLFTISLVSVYLLLYPFIYFAEKKRLAIIKQRIKIELQQLDKRGPREADNQFKSVVALDQSKDSGLDQSIEKGLSSKKIISSSNKNTAQILPLKINSTTTKKSQNRKALEMGLAEQDKSRSGSISFENESPNKLKLAPSEKQLNLLSQAISTKPSSKPFELSKSLDNSDSNKSPNIASEQLQILDRTKEMRQFRFWEQLKGASPILNMCYIDSILMPRHVRLTILFLQLLISVFVCTVYYKTTQNPINVQEQYYILSEFKYSYLPIAFIAPIFADLAMYFFAEMFRLSKSRFKNVQTVDDYRSMMQVDICLSIPLLLLLYRDQLNKQILLRYTMAYFIVGSGVVAGIWYIIQVSSKYGMISYRWQISSGLLYSTVIAWGVDFIVYQLILTLFIFLMYKCWRKFAVVLDKIRKFKQATSEEDR